MGWRDAPVVQTAKKPKWAEAPVVDAPKEPSYAATAMGVVTDLPSTLVNIPGSAANLVGGIYEAVTNPIDTVTAMADIGAGGIRNAAAMAEENGMLPKGSVSFLDSLSGDPAAAEQASARARAFGGVIADRWGSAEKIRTTLREDPVGFLADLSTILTGVGGAAKTAGLVRAGGKVADAAAVVDPLTLAGKGASAAGQQINRMVPKQAGAAAQTVSNLLPTVVQNIETTGRRILAGPKARALADVTEGRDVNALIAALEKPSAFPRTAAEAAAPTGMAEYVAMQQKLAKDFSGSEGAKKAGQTKKAIEAPLANIRGTPAQREAAVKQREAMASPFYEAADKSFLREDGALRELLGRPEVAAAAKQAAAKARSEQRVGVRGETKPSTQDWGYIKHENGRPVYGYINKPGSTAEYSGKFLSDVLEELKADYNTRKTMPTADASSNRILKNTIDDLENWYQAKSPERKTAKQLFEMYSGPINRADVGKLIFDAVSPTTLRGTSDMNFDAFAKLLEDEPATVAKALDWATTTKKFKDAGLSQNDINAIKAIDIERVNKNVTEDLERFGRAKASEAVSDIYKTGETPNMLNRFVTLFNMVKRLVGAKLSDKAIAEMALEALDPKLAAKALKEMQKKLKPAPVRQMPGMPPMPAQVKGAAKVVRAATAGARELPKPSKPGLTASGTVANTLAQAREDYPNAFITDAYGKTYDTRGNRLR